MECSEQEKKILKDLFSEMLDRGENTLQYIIATVGDYGEINRRGFIVNVRGFKDSIL